MQGRRIFATVMVAALGIVACSSSSPDGSESSRSKTAATKSKAVDNPCQYLSAAEAAKILRATVGPDFVPFPDAGCRYSTDPVRQSESAPCISMTPSPPSTTPEAQSSIPPGMCPDVPPPGTRLRTLVLQLSSVSRTRTPQGPGFLDPRRRERVVTIPGSARSVRAWWVRFPRGRTKASGAWLRDPKHRWDAVLAFWKPGYFGTISASGAANNLADAKQVARLVTARLPRS